MLIISFSYWALGPSCCQGCTRYWDSPTSSDWVLSQYHLCQDQVSSLEAFLGALLFGVCIWKGLAQQKGVGLWCREGRTHFQCSSPAALGPGHGDYTRIRDFLALHPSWQKDRRNTSKRTEVSEVLLKTLVARSLCLMYYMTSRECIRRPARNTGKKGTNVLLISGQTWRNFSVLEQLKTEK